MQQNIMHKESSHPSTAHYQLEFVLIHGGTVFDAGSVIGDGGDVVGLALGGHEASGRTNARGKKSYQLFIFWRDLGPFP